MFFVPHFVVYVSSQDFVETTLGQPYPDTKGPFMPALYPIPGLSAIPITSGPIRNPPTNPEAPVTACSWNREKLEQEVPGRRESVLVATLTRGHAMGRIST